MPTVQDILVRGLVITELSTRDCLVFIICQVTLQRFHDNATLMIIVFNKNNTKTCNL